jgi:hypothetical protein
MVIRDDILGSINLYWLTKHGDLLDDGGGLPRRRSLYERSEQAEPEVLCRPASFCPFTDES